MSMALLRAPIYLLAHGRFYDACGPNEAKSIAFSAVIASRNAWNFQERRYVSVSNCALTIMQHAVGFEHMVKGCTDF